MSSSNVITFEKDIESEIRAKSASLSDIAASSGVVQASPEKSAASWVLIVVLALLVLLSGVGAYVYYTSLERKNSLLVTDPKEKKSTVNVFEGQTHENKTSSESSKGTTTVAVIKKIIKTPVTSLLPNLSPLLQKNLVKAESYNTSFIITFTGYTEVYKTILYNEDLFLKDALLLYGLDFGTTTTIFKDSMIGETDVRVATGPITGSSTSKIYYSLIKPSFLVITNNSEDIKSITDAILK